MTRMLIAATSALAVLVGCSHSPSSTATYSPAAGSQASVPSGSRMATCPMAVPGTEVAASDAVDGETLTFTTKGDVTELRSRVREMAAMHNRHHESANAPPGMLASETMSSSRASVVDVENGADLRLTPRDAADLAKLQADVRMRAHRMRLNGCGTMEQARGG